MHKLDRIKKKLEQSKKKSIFDDITINHHLSLHAHANLNKTHPQHNTFSIFPILAKTNTAETSTTHSSRSNLESSHADPHYFISKKAQGSLIVERIRQRREKCQLGETISELAARSLNPSARINWSCQQRTAHTTALKGRQNCFISAQTPKTVIILTEPTTSGSRRTANAFRLTAHKRQSLLLRNTYTPEKEESPNRKFSISAWEAFDEE